MAKAKVCERCGRAYTYGNGGGTKYCCKECATAARKDEYNARYAPAREAAAERRAERDAQRAAGTYETRPYTRQTAAQPANDKAIKEINDKAQACGMSYGKYVCMLQMQAEAAERAKQRAKCPRTVNGIVVPERLLNARIERRQA